MLLRLMLRKSEASLCIDCGLAGFYLGNIHSLSSYVMMKERHFTRI